MTKRGKHYTEAEFEIIKKLFASGLKAKEICVATGRSKSVVWDTKRFDTFQDYKNYIKQKSLKEKAKKAQASPSLGIVGDTPPTQHLPIRPLTQENEYRVATNIERIADSLETIASFIENQSPLNREAKESFLFRRR